MTIELEQKQKRLTSGKKGCYDKVGNREQVIDNNITTTCQPNILKQYDSVIACEDQCMRTPTSRKTEAHTPGAHFEEMNKD